MNIGIFEDDIQIAHLMEKTFKRLGNNVVGIFNNSLELINAMNDNKIELLFLDINIESTINGIDCAKIIQGKNRNVKIVFITSSKDSSLIKKASFVAPNGYMIKPIDQHDLEAILMVVDPKCTIKHHKQNQYNITKSCIFDVDKSIIYSNGNILTLTYNELTCLKLLIKNKNSCVSLEQIISVIWNDYEDRTSSLRELIYRLRKKIPDLALSNVPKVGYILKF